MLQQEGLLTRIGRWIGINRSNDGELPLAAPGPDGNTETALDRPTPPPKPRLSIFRPFARRDAAIASLQQGFSSLSELMSAIRENLEKQGRRQDEMLSYLSHLPEILQSLPEAQRMQGETLRAISQQLQQQLGQQTRLTEILAKVSETSMGQKQVLDNLQAQAQTAGEHNQAISDSLRQVSSAMESVGQSTRTSSDVLQQLRESQAHRDDQLQRIIEGQNKRFSMLMIAAAVLSVAAMITTGVIGFVLLRGRGSV